MSRFPSRQSSRTDLHTMKALTFSAERGLQLENIDDGKFERAKPEGEASIDVIYAGICSTDLEITKGYVPGYKNVLGHEFIGKVASCNDRPDLIGKRVIGEINCPLDSDFSSDDACFVRNHYPRRTVLGIIGRDGAMSQRVSLPSANLHEVPDSISDKEAVFAEPLAAALRIVEQKAIRRQDKVAILGDGKMGLLVAQIVALHTEIEPLHIGRHQEKLDLVRGTRKLVLGAENKLPEDVKQAFDVSVEATGNSQGILLAVELVRPLGTVIQKSTCSIEGDKNMPDWSQIANDVVVNEKKLIGSRCGPFPAALEALQQSAVKDLLGNMITAIYPISEGIQAFEKAKSKGSLKVLLDMKETS